MQHPLAEGASPRRGTGRGAAIGVAALTDGISDWMSVCDGVTISGGEPLDQPEGVRALLLALRAREVGDILLYTGHSIDHVRAACAWVLRLVDCLVSEPFDAVAPQTLPLRGSDNQQMHRLTAVARERYPSSLDEPESPGATRKLDVFSEGRATCYRWNPATAGTQVAWRLARARWIPARSGGTLMADRSCRVCGTIPSDDLEAVCTACGEPLAHVSPAPDAEPAPSPAYPQVNDERVSVVEDESPAIDSIVPPTPGGRTRVPLHSLPAATTRAPGCVQAIVRCVIEAVDDGTDCCPVHRLARRRASGGGDRWIRSDAPPFRARRGARWPSARAIRQPAMRELWPRRPSTLVEPRPPAG
ncbi:MAG: 4Fe-4S cluster-binding domain-containing protein [Gemmatimonadetes bacterium]|nr:4Fe-4S cluster-binding domain-containing protein [Gemmatimonadota bacterium]